MAILIGIKNKSITGSSNTTEGYCSSGLNVNSFHVIKEGTQSELEAYVKKQRKEAEISRKILADMEKEFGVYSHLTEDQFEKIETEMIEKTIILEYNQLLIVEGKLI